MHLNEVSVKSGKFTIAIAGRGAFDEHRQKYAGYCGSTHQRFLCYEDEAAGEQDS